MRTLKAASVHPHEDPNVLHEPGSCEQCDKFPERQQLRAYARINFTGCNVRGWLPDPSEILKEETPLRGDSVPARRTPAIYGDYKELRNIIFNGDILIGDRWALSGSGTGNYNYNVSYNANIV